jgi:hypothetical protein
MIVFVVVGMGMSEEIQKKEEEDSEEKRWLWASQRRFGAGPWPDRSGVGM